jgi:choloylglycine hydrolase
MRAHWVWSTLVAIVLVVATLGPAAACTGITLRAADGSVIRGRTMEFGHPLDSEVVVIPRGFSLTGVTPDGKSNGLTWKATYGAGGVNALGEQIILDGVNEKGLSGGIFYFPDFAGYQEVTDGDFSQALAPWQLMTWALTSFATIDEVKDALPSVKVVASVLPQWGIVPPVHYYLADASGNSLVVEYVAGELHTYDAPLGVITNAPTFDWHMTNLRNYINISQTPQEGVDLKSVNLDPLSTGGNLFGMPGDFSSPSRFVRAVVFSQMSPQPATGQDAIEQGFHILDNFDIPEGAVPEPKGSEPRYEITEWTTMCDLKALTFSIWTSDNRAIRVLDLNNVDLDGSEIQLFALDQPQTVIEVGTSSS